MLDYSLLTQEERVQYISSEDFPINEYSPEELADYILILDDDINVRPQSKHSYWKKKDDKNSSLDEITDYVNVSKLGSNYYTAPKPKIKPYNNEEHKKEIERLQKKLILTTPNTKESSVIRHMLIQLRRQAYIYGDSEHPTICTRKRVSYYEPEDDANFDLLDITNEADVQAIYNHYSEFTVLESLEAREFLAFVDKVERRTPLKPWHRELLQYKKQGLSYKEYSKLITRRPIPRQPYCVNVLKKIYKNIAECAFYIQLEEAALNLPFKKENWRYCKICKQWYYNDSYMWRKYPKDVCKVCLSNCVEAEGSGIYTMKGDNK